MKPTQEELNNYCQKLEELLKAQDWEIELTTLDEPFISKTVGSNDDIEDWFNDVKIKLPNGDELKIFACYAGLITVKEDPNKLFTDACGLQDAVYHELNRPDPRKNLEDPYWKLWDALN